MNKARSETTRRQFLRNATASGVAATLQGLPGEAPAAAQTKPKAPQSPLGEGELVELMWLGEEPPPSASGVSWGVPWARGTMPQGQRLNVKAADGRVIPTQSWPLAFWPDGSLKWTGFAIAGDQRMDGPLSVVVATGPAPSSPMKVWEEVDGVEVNTGPMICRVARSRSALVESITVDGGEVAKEGRLVVIREDRSQLASARVLRHEDYQTKSTGFL